MTVTRSYKHHQAAISGRSNQMSTHLVNIWKYNYHCNYYFLMKAANRKKSQSARNIIETNWPNWWTKDALPARYLPAFLSLARWPMANFNCCLNGFGCLQIINIHSPEFIFVSFFPQPFDKLRWWWTIVEWCIIIIFLFYIPIFTSKILTIQQPIGISFNSLALGKFLLFP